MRTEILLIILIFTTITGCYTTDLLNPPSCPVDEENFNGDLVEKDESEFPKLQYQLVNLIKSPNPQGLANQMGIYYQDGRVQVVIVLKNADIKISERFDIITEAMSGNMVQALVLLTQLGELSHEPYVQFIRLTCEPVLYK